MRSVLIFGALLMAQSVAAAGLSKAEMQRFQADVARCWSVGVLDADAQNTVVTVTFEVDQSGRPNPQSFALVGAGKDTSQAVKDAYKVAKRAILRCGGSGYELPLEKYDQWQNIELTFNPERMR